MSPISRSTDQYDTSHLRGAASHQLEEVEEKVESEILFIAANITSIATVALTAGAAIGPMFGVIASLATIGFNAFLIKEDLPESDDYVKIAANVSYASAAINTVATAAFIFMSSLGFWAGLGVSAAVIGGTLFSMGSADDLKEMANSAIDSILGSEARVEANEATQLNCGSEDKQDKCENNAEHVKMR